MSADSAQKLYDNRGRLLPQFYDEVTDTYQVISSAHPMPVKDSYTLLPSVTITVTNAGVLLCAPRPGRRYLMFQVGGAAPVTIAPGPLNQNLVFGVGLILQSTGQAMQGSSQEFPHGAPDNDFSAITALGTTSQVTVWEA